MTYQPPPPGSPYPPGPPGGFPPPGGGQQPKFDPKAVNPLDWGIFGAALLTFIFSFIPYYTASFSSSFGSASGHINGWHGLTWFPPIAALVIIALLGLELFMPATKLPVPTRLTILVLWAISFLTILLGLFWVPIDTGGFSGIDKGHSAGFWLSAIVVIIGGVLSFLRLKATGGSLPWENRHNAGGASGGYPPPVQGGYPPPVQGGYPPPVQGGYPPPSAPPPAQGGYAPPPPGSYPPPPSGPPQAPGGYPPPPGTPPNQ